MSKPRTVRFNDQLDVLVEKYANKNNLSFNQVANLAVEQFITKPNSIELKPIKATDSQWKKGAAKAFKKHKKAMGELA